MKFEKIDNKEFSKLVDSDYTFLINYKDEMLEIPSEIKKDIDKVWEEKGSNFTNGKIFFIKEYDIDDNKKEVRLDLCNSNYAHYVYTRNNEFSEYSCVNLWSGAIVETSDKKYVLGQMSDRTICKGEYHISGGSTDLEDVVFGKVDYEKTMKREIYEELGIRIDDKDIVKDYYLKFIKLPTNKEKEYSLGFIYKVNLNISSEEFKKNFYEYKDYLKNNKLEIEFDSLLFIDDEKDKIKNLDNEIKSKIPMYTLEMYLKDN